MTTRWLAVGHWVAEECPEQPEEPEPLFRCDMADNAATVARIHNALCAEVERANRHASEMERQRNAFGEALTRIANGELPASAARDAMVQLSQGSEQ